jgi:hypothetical protein
MVILLATVAALYLVRLAWRALSGKAGCGSGACAKASEPPEALIPPEELILRLKRH